LSFLDGVFFGFEGHTDDRPDARDCHQPPANVILARELGEMPIEQRVLPAHEIARVQGELYCNSQLRFVLEQASYPRSKRAAVDWADLQSMNLQ
jgi:hypothetical protein